jgi:hypothetical protein
MGTKIYPSLANLIAHPTSIKLKSDKGVVVGPGQVIVSNRGIPVENSDSGYAKALDRMYPMWRAEREFLHCTEEEYVERIKILTSLWASNRMNHTPMPVKYIPPGKHAEWKASLGKPDAAMKFFVHPLAINSSFALIAIRVDEKEDFTVAFSKLDGTLKGFYRPSPLKLPFVSNACLTGATGFVADAKNIYRFRINGMEMEILWKAANPTYPKQAPSNATEQLLTDFAEILLAGNEKFILVAKQGEQVFVLDATTGKLWQELPLRASSLYLTEGEISCGTFDGKIVVSAYKVKGEKLKLYPKVNRTVELAKTWEVSLAAPLEVPPQPVNTHVSVRSFTVASLDTALIMGDSAANQHSVVNDTEGVVSIAFVGDLAVLLTQSYTLYFTPLCQAVPAKKVSLYVESKPAPYHRQLVCATPHCVWVLAATGEINKIELLQ